MQIRAITGHIDVAQVTLCAFWGLRHEDERQGYPLVTERSRYLLGGFPFSPARKSYVLETLLDGEKLRAHFAGGQLFAEPKRGGTLP